MNTQPMKTPDNPPAFPQSKEIEEGYASGGLSLRDYFAAHAPAIPQPWFTPVLAKRPEDDWRVGEWRATSHDYAIQHAIKNGGSVRNENRGAQERYDKDSERQRFIQWPYAWADMMLLARSTPPASGANREEAK